jgi:hypothetical protein
MSNEERIAKLEAELAELRKKSEPPEPFVPKKPWQKWDPTEQLVMPASAVKPMADLVHDVKDKDFDTLSPEEKKRRMQNAWAQTKIGGLSPLLAKEKKPEPAAGWKKETPLGPPSGTKYVDQIVDHFDALDKAELVKRTMIADAIKGSSK